MPIYEYKCRQCNHEFEKLVRSFSGSPDIFCQNCGSAKVVKLVSTFAFSGSESTGNSVNSGSACSTCTSSNCSTCGH